MLEIYNFAASMCTFLTKVMLTHAVRHMNVKAIFINGKCDPAVVEESSEDRQSL